MTDGFLPELGKGANRRGLIVLLADTFLMWAGFFMVVPLIAVHYVDGLGWAAASVGLVLAALQLLKDGLTPISGMFADRLGAKGLICAGLLVRAAGFVMLAGATTFPLLLGSATLAAVGGGLFGSPRMAAIAALSAEADRPRVYALNGVIGGLGTALGTQVGVLLLGVDFALVAWVAAGCFVVTFLVTLLFLPDVRLTAEPGGLTHGIGRALRDRPFMVFNVLLLGYWFLWVQFTISLPLAGKAISGTAEAVGWIYGINAGMAVLLQYPLARLAGRLLRPPAMLALGLGLMALGFGGVALARDVPLLLACVVGISTGVLLATPSQQTMTANLAHPAALGSYFGVNSLAVALGSGLGSFGGGLFYDLGRQFAFPALPWLAFGAVGLAAAGGLALIARQRET